LPQPPQLARRPSSSAGGHGPIGLHAASWPLHAEGSCASGPAGQPRAGLAAGLADRATRDPAALAPSGLSALLATDVTCSGALNHAQSGPETIILITEMAAANRLWGAERIRGAVLKLNSRVATTTVQRSMAQRLERQGGPVPLRAGRRGGQMRVRRRVGGQPLHSPLGCRGRGHCPHLSDA